MNMNVDDSLWTTMKIHAFYHEIPWMSMYIHGLSSPISTGWFFDHPLGRLKGSDQNLTMFFLT